MKGSPIRRSFAAVGCLLGSVLWMLADEPASNATALVRSLHLALKSANPGYKDNGVFKLDQAGRVIEVSLKSAPEVADITPLKGLPLVSITLRGTKVKEISALAGMPLDYANLSDAVEDLAPLKEAPLSYLSIGPRVTDLRCLSGKKLTSLSIGAHSPITDLSPLEGMPLKSLCVYACRGIKDLGPLRQARLKSLNIEATSVGDLAPLAGQPLENARLCTAFITSIAPLAGMPLKVLDLTNAKGLADITPLRNATAMEDLRLDFTGVSDLSVLRQMPRLRILSVLDCPHIADLSVLQGLAVQALILNPQRFSPGEMEKLRHLSSLKWIDNDWSHWDNSYSYNPRCEKPCRTAEEFWRRYDAGEFKGPASQPERAP